MEEKSALFDVAAAGTGGKSFLRGQVKFVAFLCQKTAKKKFQADLVVFSSRSGKNVAL